MTTIYWFRRDRRLSDNPALLKAVELAKASEQPLLPIAIKQDNPVSVWGFERMGPHRLAFEHQSLAGLAQSLQSLGRELYQPTGQGIKGVLAVAHEVKAHTLVCEQIVAPEELDEIEQLKAGGIQVVEVEQSALLPQDELPFDTADTPLVFSDFRRLVEKNKCLPRTPLLAPNSLPALPSSISSALPYASAVTMPALDERSALPYQLEHWHGDERSGQAHVRRYFESSLARRYKETRNGLIGTDYSTKFSPWLAVGAVSAAQIWQTLQEHESRHGANDSTYWIWFELLWRDHFRLMLQRFGRRLFRRSGLSKSPLAPKTHDKQGFDRWCHGQTGNDFIDAAMRELSHTGYLSNRMRQNVASYLIHDLGCDWLAGAAWFEHCLMDFDVHSNQGNWAYIAGVGTDPRGGRRFNPEKQAHDYDRDASYRKLWNTT